MRKTLLVSSLMLAAVFIAADKPEPVKPATVKMKRADIVAEITLDNGRKLTISGTPTPVTPGTYTVKALSIYKKDEKGKVWELRGLSDLGGLNMFAVDPGQDKVIDAGPPASFQGWARPDPGDKTTVRMRFSLKGRSNEGYYPSAYVNGVAAPPAAFRLVSSDEKVLLEDKFTISKTGDFEYVWHTKGWRGKYKIEIKPNLGPFDYVWPHDKTNYTLD